MMFLQGLSRTLVQFASLTAQYPHCLEQQWPQPPTPTAQWPLTAQYLGQSESLDRRNFAGEVLRAASDEALRALLGSAVTALHAALLASGRDEVPLLLLPQQEQSVGPHRALDVLCASARVAPELVAQSAWLPAGNGRALAERSVLGPFFAPSSCPDDARVAAACFADMSREEAFPAYDRLRHRLEQMQAALHASLLALLKCKPARAPTLAWLCAAVVRNAPRVQEQPQWNGLATHGWALNLCAVLGRLCAPIKVASVDSDYCVWNRDGFECAGDTRLCLDEPALAARLAALRAASPQGPPEASFTTQVFWLATRAAGTGWRAAARYYGNVLRALEEREDLLDRAVRHAPGAPPPHLQGELRNNVAMLRRDALALECHVKDPRVLTDMCGLYDMVARWFALAADPAATGVWPESPPPAVAQLPAWLIDDLVYFYEWLAQHARDILLRDAHHQQLLSFLTHCLHRDQYLRNPYLRGRLVELMLVLIPNPTNGLPAALFESNATARDLLVPALLRFYIDVERTGGHNQFFDKVFCFCFWRGCRCPLTHSHGEQFSIRYRVSGLLEYLWHAPGTRVFRDAFIAQCHDRALMLRFVTLLTNDATYLLDEALTKLEQIHEVEVLHADAAAWGALPPAEREAKLERHRTLVDSTRSYNLLSMASIQMFRYLSAEVVEPFMADELLERQATTLNYFLVQLAGPKCSELKIRDPQAVSFDPRRLLRTLCQIYVNFHTHPAFAAQVVRDERSYRHTVFLQAAAILRNKISGVTSEEVGRFECFVMDCERVSQQTDDNEPWTDDDIPGTPSAVRIPPVLLFSTSG